MVIEKVNAQFGDCLRNERKHRRCCSGQLAVDLGRGIVFVGTSAAADLPLTVQVVDPPRSMVEEIRDLADPPSLWAALALNCHVHPPGARFVHQMGFLAAHKKR